MTALRPLVGREPFTLSVTGLLLLLLNLAPVSSSLLGRPIAVAAALLAVCNPPTWMLYVAASQNVADPAGLPLTLSQLSVVVWLITLPINGCLRDFRRLGPYLVYVLPFLLWFYAAFLVVRGVFYAPMLNAAIIGAISYVYAIRGRARLPILLAALLCGLAFALMGYWSSWLGLPVIADTYHLLEHGVAMDRIGSGRGDANLVGATLPLLVAGSFALAITARHWTSSRKLQRFANLAALAAFFLSVPAVGGTVSRGGIYSLVLAVSALVPVVLLTSPRDRMPVTRIFKWFVVPVVAMLAMALFSTSGAGSFLNATITNVDARNGYSATAGAGPTLLAGRQGMWQIHLALMLQHPIGGVPKGEIVDFEGYGTVAVGIDELYVTAHNAFLDIGSSSGVPGLLLYLILFFRAPYQLVIRRGMGFAAPFLAVWIAIFLALMSLSLGNWKTFWALLAIVLVAVEGSKCAIGSATHRPTRDRDVRGYAGRLGKWEEAPSSVRRGFVGGAAVLTEPPDYDRLR